MINTPEGYIQTLVQISEKKLNCLKNILSLTMTQNETINEEGMDGLQNLIDEKQAKIDEINRLDDEFNACFTAFKQKLGISSLDEAGRLGVKGAKELQDIVVKIVELLREISEAEKKNKEKADNLLNYLGAKIREIREGRRISSAYSSAASVSPPSYFFDKKK
ncbi:MAG TPA: flagellar export chaperone FlgN [Acetivibrio sp.]|uniref:flagellar export chaperone FlgN n=1 Tax=Acetivibrio sp. TaxID=1872092 RepID=UPI002C02828D|nr:flagellar export chaperone FlgN [Acetivibrio sp.]HOM01290.1 flagellar export chaperone FlgN [Acetivibrio sp.]